MILMVFYWIILLLLLIFYGWWGFTSAADQRLHVGGSGLLVFILFLIIGIALWGNPANEGGRAPAPVIIRER